MWRVWPRAGQQVVETLEAESLTDEDILGLVQEASLARLREFRRCTYCGRSFPPEHSHGDVCHGCAERHLGIDH